MRGEEELSCVVPGRWDSDGKNGHHSQGKGTGVQRVGTVRVRLCGCGMGVDLCIVRIMFDDCIQPCHSHPHTNTRSKFIPFVGGGVGGWTRVVMLVVVSWHL